jgi:aspartate/tyrosine/aromatic aminotransferase
LRVEKRHNNRYVVKNPKTNSLYGVSAGAASIVCDSPDYQKQADAIGKEACKHGYAVPNHLGYSTLAEYVQAKVQPEINPIPVRASNFVRVGDLGDLIVTI